MADLLAEASTLKLAAAAAIVFLAAIVRGYSGFGFSLLSITALSLLYPPAAVIPPIFLLEIAASIHMLPGLWREIHWRSIAWLIPGCLAGTPLGVWALASVPPAPMTVALAVFVLAATLLLWRGYALKAMPNAAATVAIGTAAGAANGAFGIGGPPVILFYFASPAGHAAGRASLVFYFLATDSIGLAVMSREGLVTWDSAVKAAVFLPALAVGIWIGARRFRSADPAKFRRIILILLAVLAIVSAVKAAAAL